MIKRIAYGFTIKNPSATHPTIIRQMRVSERYLKLYISTLQYKSLQNSHSTAEHNIISNNIKCKSPCVQGPRPVIVENKGFWNSDVPLVSDLFGTWETCDIRNEANMESRYIFQDHRIGFRSTTTQSMGMTYAQYW